jgi:hypothetical protein
MATNSSSLMSMQDRSPIALEQDSKRQKTSHPSDMDQNITDHLPTHNVNMHDASPMSDSPSPSTLPRVLDNIPPHLHKEYNLEVNTEDKVVYKQWHPNSPSHSPLRIPTLDQ